MLLIFSRLFDENSLKRLGAGGEQSVGRTSDRSERGQSPTTRMGIWLYVIIHIISNVLQWQTKRGPDANAYNDSEGAGDSLRPDRSADKLSSRL